MQNMNTATKRSPATRVKADTSSKKPDGRLLRSERSRQLIMDATQELVNEGVLVPTAQNVADRAGVGIRTVFRHFADMETLFATMDSQLRESYENLFMGGDRAGTLPERIQHAIERRATAYEKLSSVMLSTRAQMWRSPTLQKNYARNQRGLRKDLGNWLPEMADLTTAKSEAVDAAASFETWNRLRMHQSLSKKASMEVVFDMLSLAFGVGQR
jgi:AcrR family transcriptional regulator